MTQKTVSSFRLFFLSILAMAIVSGFVVYVYAAETAGATAGVGQIPGQYIVVLKDSVTDADITRADLSRRAPGEYMDTYYHAFRGFSARLSADALAKVQADPRVAFVSEDRVVSIAQTDDPRSALRDTNSVLRQKNNSPAQAQKPLVQSQTLPTGIDRINAENKANRGAGVNVAVIDTGIATDHPDLKSNIVGGKNCSTGTSYADQNGHGTHVAGTIAALNNGFGVVGVAPEAKLWAVRVLDRNGNGTWSSIICGLDFVTANAPKNGGPIKVANLSLGGSGVSDNNCGNTNNDALHKAICRARDAGVTIVVAAGNSGLNANTFVPAAYDDAVITVSALADSDGKLDGLGKITSYGADDTFATFSNFGSVVDIGAPGVSIYSTWLNNAYNTISGTSMASPHVSGAAALYIATHPSALWSEVRSALIAAGESAGNGHTDPGGKHPEPVLRADTL